MLTLRVVHAHFGDCLLLVHGTSKAKRYLLVDGGPAKTFEPHLAKVLAKIKPAKLDAVCLSHVDTDHTTGLQELFAELRDRADDGDQPLVAVRDFWINQFGTTIDADGKAREIRLAQILQALSTSGSMQLASAALTGIKHGHNLVVIAHQLGIAVNKKTKEQPWIAGTIAKFKHGDIDVSVVGPTQKNLAALRHEWDVWLDAQQKKIDEEDIRGAIKADDSVPNLSSIQLLVETRGAKKKRLLLTGDGRGDHLIEALGDAKLLDANGGIDVDVLKLPHHGSARNVKGGFFEHVRAKTYVISANGRDDNPDDDTLEWLFDAAAKQQRRFKLVLTNLPPRTKKLLDKQQHPFDLVVRDPKKDYVDVKLA